jgi:hypothetical protein
VYCNGADGLFGALGHVHNTEEWRLSMGLSKVSLKAVLLHNGNIYPSVRLTYSVHMKDPKESMRIVLNCIDCDRYRWKICRYLAVL